MKNKTLAKEIIALKEADLTLRNRLVQEGVLNEGYHQEMETLHIRNAELLNGIIDEIGYPTVDKVGEEACEAAWLVIQHSISKPGFMKKCRTLLAKAVVAQQAPAANLAYLTDRIAVFEGNPQQYGTQFDWDENGELSPTTVEDLIEVNQRRKSVGLNPLEEQIEIMRRKAKEENQLPPMDAETKKEAYEQWKKKVGWVC